MPLFRRREPLHERLAREAGLELDPDRPLETRTPWQETGIHGLARPRRWDAVVTTRAELQGERARFVVLPDGTAVIEDGPEDVAPLADAVEQELGPPYRAEAVARGGGVWAVAAARIRVVEAAFADADELELTVRDGSHTLLADGAAVFGSVRELEALLGGENGVVRARRIDGDNWEVQVDRL